MTSENKVMAHTGSEYSAMAGTFSAAKGELRKLNVSAGLGGPSYMSYQKVPSRLAAFCDELNLRRREVDPADVAAIYDLSFRAHYELVTIHPWADGNGRTSRLLMNLLQWEFGVLPTKVLKEDKAVYIKALADTREHEDINIFLDCMAQLHIEHLMHDIDLYVKSVEDVPQTKWLEDGQKTTTKWPEKWPEKWPDLASKIIEAIKADSKVTIADLEQTLGLGHTTIKKLLREMRNEQFIRRVGPDKGGHWEIIDKKV